MIVGCKNVYIQLNVSIRVDGATELDNSSQSEAAPTSFRLIPEHSSLLIGCHCLPAHWLRRHESRPLAEFSSAIRSKI